jgi:hypothetical protein
MVTNGYRHYLVAKLGSQIGLVLKQVVGLPLPLEGLGCQELG